MSMGLSLRDFSRGGKSGQHRVAHHLTGGVSPQGGIQKVPQKITAGLRSGKGENVG